MYLPPEELLNEAAKYAKAIKKHGSIRAAARALKIPESTIRTRLKKAEAPMFIERKLPEPLVRRPYPDRNRYFILTGAQDGSSIHLPFWHALQKYAAWLGDCEIMVSGFTYSKRLFEDHDKRSDKVHFSPEVAPFIVHDRILLGNDADGVEFCAEMNTLPTAARPLSGFQSYTKHRWGIFPHTKVHLESVPTMKHTRAKQLMTTGVVTRPNYIRKKEGIKAMFHHIIGAVLVELCPDGTLFCRHLLASNDVDGNFYDLDRLISPFGVTTSHRAEGLTYGDIHHEKLDHVVALATWGYDRERLQRRREYPSLVQLLQPKHEFFHDLSDFAPRNHHNLKDIHFRFAVHQEGRSANNVADALRDCSTFLREVYRTDSQQVVVESNHDQALVRWLKEADYKTDPENAVFFLECQLSYYKQLANGMASPKIFEDVLRAFGAPEHAAFVDEDSSYVICGDIECGMHGHLGANGSRGSVHAFSKMGAKSNTGHSHSPAIFDGAYVGGVSALLDLVYNRGLSSWLHAHILTYPNGKRTILTMNNGKFHANDIDHRTQVRGSK